MLPPGTVLAPQAPWTIVAARGLEQTGDQKRASLSGKWGLSVAPLPPSGAPGPLAVQAWEQLGLAEGAFDFSGEAPLELGVGPSNLRAARAQLGCHRLGPRETWLLQEGKGLDRGNAETCCP